MVCKGLAADTQTKFYCVSIKKKQAFVLHVLMNTSVCPLLSQMAVFMVSEMQNPSGTNLSERYLPVVWFVWHKNGHRTDYPSVRTVFCYTF